MYSIYSLIITLGVLIFVHEFGHFLFAKLFKVKVLTFSLGFGPKLFGKKFGETDYIVSALPLGGYVRMVGQGEDEFSVPEEEKDRAFVHKPVWQRFLIILAGPVFNLLLPVLLFFIVYMSIGVPVYVDNTTIGTIGSGSPAEISGLKVDDQIISINGTKTEKWKDVSTLVKESGGQPLRIEIVRDGAGQIIEVQPQIEPVKDEYGKEIEKRYLLGIVMKTHYRDATVLEAFKLGCLNTYRFVEYTVTVVKKLITRDVPASEMGGVLMIAKMAGDQMQAGILDFISFLGVLSINLGILNLLPIPVLDGGHLVFLTYETVMRRPMSERVLVVAQQIGMALLITLMIFAFYNDIIRFFFK